MHAPRSRVPPGALLAALVLLAGCLAPARAKIMAVDLGSDFLKVSLVKPGRIPISIVHNEISKRKTAAAVALVGGDRLVGEEAAALAVRYPTAVFTRLRDLLGRRHDDPAVLRMLQRSRLPFQVVPAPNRTDGAAGVRTDTGDVYSAEELVVRRARSLPAPAAAMPRCPAPAQTRPPPSLPSLLPTPPQASLLEYAKSLAQAAADGAPISDCVLVVPAFFDQAQRRALLDAAALAGLNVMGLVHAHAAAALQYGIERDFTNRTEDVLFYDLGAGAAQAALVRFSSFAAGAGPAVSQFEVRDVAWVEHGVGGEALEAALLEHLAAEAGGEGGAAEVLASPRAVEKLRRQARRAKEVLSANSEASLSVEDLLPGRDFRARVARDQFEALAGEAWARAAAPVVELLRRNNLTGGDLAAVELLGGTSRVPRVKAALVEALGGRALDMCAAPRRAAPPSLLARRRCCCCARVCVRARAPFGAGVLCSPAHAPP
jgi:hypoxia up-regulated 1